MTWINADDQLPPSGQKVIVCFKNPFGYLWRTVAMYQKQYTLICNETEMVHDWAEYHDELDEYFVPEGWYEDMYESETSWHLSQKILFWHELPDLPQTTSGGGDHE